MENINLIKALSEKAITISLAESMTGGLLSYNFTKHPGASKVFIGSVVAYNKDVKTKLLKVDIDTINNYSVVSSNVAKEMVNGLSELIPATINIAVTGNAGPTVDLNTNKLECFIAILFKGLTEEIHLQFNSNNRNSNIDLVIKTVLEKVQSYL